LARTRQRSRVARLIYGKSECENSIWR